MNVFFPVYAFDLLLLALALWAAWLAWTRSRAPFIRVFATVAALLWAFSIAASSWRTYKLGAGLGTASSISSGLTPLEGKTRVCSFCYSGPAGGVYVVAGAKMSHGDYTISRAAHYSLRFADGSVRLAGRSLEPGCYEGDAPAGTRVEIARAREFRLEVGKEASCK